MHLWCTYGASLEEIRCSTNLRRPETSQPQCGERTVYITNATGFDLKISRGNRVLVSRRRCGGLPNPATPSQSIIDDIHHADMGRYCYRRLPFGITSAPEIFMRKMNEHLHGLDGVFTYMDYIMIYLQDKAEHDERLNKVLKVLASAGLKLNRDKSVIGQSHLKFLGHVFDANGIRSCPHKVRAIL